MKNYFPQTLKGHKLEALGTKPLAAFARICNKVAGEGVVDAADVLPELFHPRRRTFFGDFFYINGIGWFHMNHFLS